MALADRKTMVFVEKCQELVLTCDMAKLLDMNAVSMPMQAIGTQVIARSIHSTATG